MRTELLLGADTTRHIACIRVIIFGVGGVGSWCAESLIRSGIGHLTMVDFDRVCTTNINRQLMATTETVGQLKAEVLKERLLTINPSADIVAIPQMYTAETADSFQLDHYDYIIDAIDSVADKTELLLYASRVRACKVYSSMGAALRFDPTKVMTGELMSVKGDSLARAVRERMKRLDRKPSKKIRCVYSTEQAQRCETRGSLMQVTAVFGLTLASMVIADCRREE